MRFIIPIILLIISVASFVMFSNPSYQRIKALKAESAQYDQALSNSRKLQEERDTLGQKYNAIPPASLDRLNKLLPDTADNIRLIIDIQRIASAYGISLSSIKFDAKQTNSTAPATTLAAGAPADITQSMNDYGTFSLEFGVTTSYDNFLKFMKDLESSLRLTDVQSVTFTTDNSAAGINKTLYTIKLNTYWLKS